MAQELRPAALDPRTERVQVRYTEDELQRIWSKGESMDRLGVPGMRKPDGSVNLSAVIRHLTLKVR